MADAVHELLVTERVLEKLGQRGISDEEAAQLPQGRHVIVRNPSPAPDAVRRRLLIGRTQGGRLLTLVIESTIEPTTWVIVTGWSSTTAERNLLER